MIEIVEIPVERIEEFWEIHIKYLVEDNIIEAEDVEYFTGDEYRGLLKRFMQKEINRHHMIYFVKDQIKIGACQYTTYQSEDGKCFILDFWIFNEFRGRGLGRECFKALTEYTQKDGAKYYALNYSNERNHHFWLSLGFIDDGVDEYNVPLMVKQ